MAVLRSLSHISSRLRHNTTFLLRLVGVTPTTTVPVYRRGHALLWHQPVCHVSYSSRSHYCDEVGLHQVGQEVRLAGWLQAIRMDKFLLLRDRTGTVQLRLPEHSNSSSTGTSTSTSSSSQSLGSLINLPLESVVAVRGTVRKRPAGQDNPRMRTGQVEVELTGLELANPAKTNLPFQQKERLLPKEPLRMQYRYLDLRRAALQQHLRMRSELVQRMRTFLCDQGFLDIETPTLFRRTPGGAKEFVVPTQTKDRFYSLVQSPQQFKQLLMVGGVDRYFQIARCYRDEGGKPDRQPEFTQVDIELSFGGREEVIQLVEDLLAASWPHTTPPRPLPRITYQEAMDNYGVDKPDLRFDNKIQDVSACFSSARLPFLQEFTEGRDYMAGGLVFDAEATNDTASTKRILKEAEQEVRQDMALHIKQFTTTTGCLLTSLRLDQGTLTSSVLKKCPPQVAAQLAVRLRDCAAGSGDSGGAGFLAFGPRDFVLPLLGRLRNVLARSLVPDMAARADSFTWVVDFPLFLVEDGVLESAHHPFTAAHPEDHHLLRTDPLRCRSLHYDLVLNGQEIAGGSVRIHNGEEQRYVLEQILGEDSSELTHLLEALDSGAPPHAGIALGLDRLVAILCRAESIRDVIAFPKSAEGRDLMAEAPARITASQRQLYHLPPETPQSQS